MELLHDTTKNIEKRLLWDFRMKALFATAHIVRIWVKYPPVDKHGYGKSSFLIGTR
jgi:hypothetical protein